MQTLTAHPRLLLLILACGAFVTSLNTTMISPLLPLIAADFRVTDAAAGQIATLTAACAGLTALVAAPWMDRYTRGAALRCEAFILGVGTVLSLLAPSMAWLFAGRAIAGIGGGVIFALCLAAVGDLFSTVRQRNWAVGVVGTAATLGVVLGLPIMTQLGARGGWRVALLPILPLITLLFAGSYLLPRIVPPREGACWQGWRAGYRHVLTDRPTLALLGVMITLCLAWFGWLVYFGGYAHAVFGVGAGTLAALFVCAGVAEILANILAPLLLQRYAGPGIIVAATAVLSATLIGTSLIGRHVWVLVPFVVLASLASVVLFVVTSICLLDAQPQARGTVMALQSSGFELGGALGAAAVGAGLALAGDYTLVYRVLGVAVPLLLLPLLLGGRRATLPSARPIPGEAEPCPAVAQ